MPHRGRSWGQVGLRQWGHACRGEQRTCVCGSVRATRIQYRHMGTPNSRQAGRQQADWQDGRLDGTQTPAVASASPHRWGCAASRAGPQQAQHTAAPRRRPPEAAAAATSQGGSRASYVMVGVGTWRLCGDQEGGRQTAAFRRVQNCTSCTSLNHLHRNQPEQCSHFPWHHC